MPKFRKLSQKREWPFWIFVPILKPTLLATTVPQWSNAEKIPATGGVILAVNHISHADPLLMAHLIWDWGRLPRFMGKKSVFDNAVLGRMLTACGQIPVDRSDAHDAYHAAIQALRDGELVVVYPEGSITKDPDGWPMRGKSGAARMALETGCPVIPVGQWGARDLLPAYSHKPNLRGRATIRAKVGDPVDLADLLPADPGAQITPEATTEATDRIMASITSLVEDVRGGTAPADRFDPRQHGLRETGNPEESS